MEFLPKLLGRCDPACNKFLNRPQIAGLVVTGPVMLAAPPQPLLGKLQRLLGEIEHAPLPDMRLEAEPRHLVAQLLAFLRAPILDQIPGRVERSLVIEQPDPEGRKCRQPSPGSAIGAAHLEIALETHLRKDGGD